MVGIERGRTGSEQLLVLWTWLLKGYVPVAHMVADLDELEALASNDSGGDAPRGRVTHAALQLVDKNAA